MKLFALYYIIRIKAFRSWSLWKKYLKLYITIQIIFSYNFSLFTYFLLIYGDCCSWRPRAWRQVTWWHDDVRWLIRGPGRNSFTFNQRILDEKWNRLTKWFLKDTNCFVSLSDRFLSGRACVCVLAYYYIITCFIICNFKLPCRQIYCTEICEWILSQCRKQSLNECWADVIVNTRCCSL